MSVTIESTAGFAADDPLARLHQGIAAIADEREPDAIWLLLDLVEAALRASRMSEATAAQAWADRAAAQPWAAKLARPRGERRASGALTLRELEIAELAAAGLSNKQIGRRLFLSDRTVSAHLYHVFPKLGITSRAALRDALNARRVETERNAARPPPGRPVIAHFLLLATRYSRRLKDKNGRQWILVGRGRMGCAARRG
jgi:DNA-binding CsgD family transcriptional regulator